MNGGPAISRDWVNVYHGDCREVLAALPDANIDAIVTDPPYELAFMGKKWDASGIAYDPVVWSECLRVLKPGGHLLAFGGTRTWHRLAVAIEDAGFEVRDSIAWMYGSGFPKSLDVSKAIDKRGGAQVAWFGPWFRKWREDNGVTQKQVAALFPSRSGGLTGCVANWELGFNMPTPDQFNLIRDTFGLPFDSIAEAEREVVGRGTSAIANKDERDRYTVGAGKAVEFDITTPATPAAQQWQGWGTALKPAFEPIVVARKPLIGTVAENVLTHGTGALNIDGCRIATDDLFGGGSKATSEFVHGYEHDGWQPGSEKGRWPANVILDESQAAELDRQSGVQRDGVAVNRNRMRRKPSDVGYAPIGIDQVDVTYGGEGGASRFFYVPKANNKERPRDGDTAHPTVKPLALMRYLVRLVTPPAGIVLDPFAGSGSTVEACFQENMNAIGIELTEDYLPLIEQRIDRCTESGLW